MDSAQVQASVTESDFESIARESRPYLMQIAVASSRNPVDAEDIVQEALVRAFRGISRFRGDCPMKVWLSRIVVRVAINHHRSLSRRLKRWVLFGDFEITTEDGSTVEFDPPDRSKAFPRELMLDMERQVGKLPDEFRMPLLMLAVEGMTIPEIAEILEIPEGTVKSRIFYARKRLKGALEKKKR